MQNLIWKIMPPKEVRRTIKSAREFLDANSGGLLDSYVSSIAKKDAKEIVRSIRNEENTPERASLFLVALVLHRQLGSGNHHVYRGALNMAGKDLLRLWHCVWKTILDRGYASEDEVERATQALMDDIKNVG